jgi:hypothetical protein
MSRDTAVLLFVLFIAFGPVAFGPLFGALERCFNHIKEQHRRCQHGVPGGNERNCSRCLAEATRSRQEKAALDTWEYQAMALRQREIERLSRAWMGNAESYFAMNPRDFENAIAELFRRLGYEVTQTPFQNDRGRDAVAFKGPNKFVIECKRYADGQMTGRPDLQRFFAAMHEEKATGGFFVSTGRFARPAREYAADNRIKLYDRDSLPSLVNEAYPTMTDFPQAQAVCLRCGSTATVPVGDTPETGHCQNGHEVIGNIVRTDLRIFRASGMPYCKRHQTPMRLMTRRNRKVWRCPRYRCKEWKRFEEQN